MFVLFGVVSGCACAQAPLIVIQRKKWRFFIRKQKINITNSLRRPHRVCHLIGKWQKCTNVSHTTICRMTPRKTEIRKKRTSINRKSIRCVVFFKHSGLKFRPLTTTHQTLVFFRKKTHSREKHTKKYYNEINLMYLRHELNFNWKREEKKKKQRKSSSAISAAIKMISWACGLFVVFGWHVHAKTHSSSCFERRVDRWRTNDDLNCIKRRRERNRTVKSRQNQR